MRTNVMESKLVSSLRSLLSSVITHSGSGGTTKQSKSLNLNQPRPSSDPREREKHSGDYKLNKTWLVQTPYDVDIEHQPHSLQYAHEDDDAREQGFVDVKRLSCPDGPIQQPNNSELIHLRPTNDSRGGERSSEDYELTESLSVDSLYMVDI